MSDRGRSASPRGVDADVDMDAGGKDKPHAKAVVIQGLTRSVVEAHIKAIFGFYGEITKTDMPMFTKCEYCIQCQCFDAP
jgi:RNA-binding protein with serine-rich domain 1